MDGPMVAFVYQDLSETSDSTLGEFEENNTYILLWKSSQIDSTYQKYNLLAHCDSLLECFSDIFAFYHLHQVTLKKRHLCINKSIGKLLPLLIDTPIMMEDMNESLTKNNQYLRVLDARVVYGEMSKKDRVLIEVLVQNLTW
ncbi:13830_t:CDS:2 [Racocetra fulgida]|uniref:13830_t:CDS:1 n=1 Tax=Racocetra fulgida TaxID=60492 RepID=A0A9N9EP11_9GLOM|nr:13830_t:CDS:2 [Racocetra fulgida]